MKTPELAPSRRALALRVLAGATLIAGWTDLVYGGISAGPLLIVAGYAVLVPGVILTWR
ncbi:MAG: hypothetical protein ABIY52_06555 [Gemmatimonadaceae bacterium]